MSYGRRYYIVMDEIELTLTAPAIFVALAHHYGVTPERLGNALVYSFCALPPETLTLVQRFEASEWDESVVRAGLDAWEMDDAHLA